MKNHEHRPSTMKNQPGTTKNHENQPITIKKTNLGARKTMKTDLEP